jgi:hypothetical protein
MACRCCGQIWLLDPELFDDVRPLLAPNRS